MEKMKKWQNSKWYESKMAKVLKTLSWEEKEGEEEEGEEEEEDSKVALSCTRIDVIVTLGSDNLWNIKFCPSDSCRGHVFMKCEQYL